ncbi:MAG: TonB-dependent receptor [Pseudomonadota bacterium]
MKKLMCGSLLAATMLTPSVVAAQDNETSAEEAGSGNVIIVTARKREEDLQSVPTSVAVVTADTIDNLGLDNLEDIAQTTPGLIFDDSFGRDSNRPVIRGQANILGQSGVAFFIDGIYYTGSLADYDVDTIERIEVVKGPQSALYGRNTYSGAINIISKLPGDRWEGRVQADISENDRYELTAGIRGPISEGLAIGFNGRYFDFGGEFTNAFDGEKLGQQQSYSLSSVLDWDNGGPFTATLRGYYNRTDDGQPAIFATANADNNCLFDNGGLYNGNGRYFCGVIRPGTLNSDFTRQFAPSDLDDVGIEADTYNVSLRMEYEIGDGLTLTSLTGYNNREQTTLTDGDYTPENFTSAVFAFFPAPFISPVAFGAANAGDVTDFTFASRSETEDWSQELRLTYESDSFDFIVGGYYFDQDDDSFSIRNLPADADDLAESNLSAVLAARCSDTPGCVFAVPLTPLNPIATPRDENLLDIRNIALFGAVEWHITPELNLGFEGRYQEERIRQTVFDFDLGDARPAGSSNQTTFKEFTPRITADYQFTPDNLLYAIYSEGQKPGGFNGTVAIEAGLPTFEPEDVTSYEIGLKNTFLDGALIANLAVFRNNIDGYQLTQLAQTSTNSVTATVNAGDARINGLEFEVLARPSERFTFTANYALADTRFTSGFDQNEGVLIDVADNGRVDCSTGEQFPDLGCTINGTPVPAFGSIDGRRIPRAPVHRIFADADWRAPLGNGDWEVFTGANVSLTSSSFAQVANLAETGDSIVVDARLGVQNDNFRIQAYVDNLTDETSVQQLIRYADPSFRRNFIGGLRPGRRFGVIVTANY